MNGEPIPGWFDTAICKGQTAVMFAGDKADGTAAAKAICATCPHTAPCLQYAIDNDIRFGVWGGQGPRTRNPKADARHRPTCGTYSGYRTHIERNETPCAGCYQARRQYRRRWIKGVA